MSRPALYVVKMEDGRYATKAGWAANPVHASKHPSRYAAKRWAGRVHPAASWKVEQLYSVDHG